VVENTFIKFSVLQTNWNCCAVTVQRSEYHAPKSHNWAHRVQNRIVHLPLREMVMEPGLKLLWTISLLRPLFWLLLLCMQGGLTTCLSEDSTTSLLRCRRRRRRLGFPLHSHISHRHRPWSSSVTVTVASLVRMLLQAYFTSSVY